MKGSLCSALVYAGVLLAVTATGFVSVLQPGAISRLALFAVAVLVIAAAFVINKSNL